MLLPFSLLAQPFTHSLPARIHKAILLNFFFFETVIGEFSGGYFKAKDCLMIGSYVCSLNSELFLHTVKNHSFLLLETNKC